MNAANAHRLLVTDDFSCSFFGMVQFGVVSIVDGQSKVPVTMTQIKNSFDQFFRTLRDWPPLKSIRKVYSGIEGPLQLRRHEVEVVRA